MYSVQDKTIFEAKDLIGLTSKSMYRFDNLLKLHKQKPIRFEIHAQ